MGNINTSTWDLYRSGDLEFEDTPKDGGSSFGVVSGKDEPHIFESQDSILSQSNIDKLDALNSDTGSNPGGVGDNSNNNQKPNQPASGNTPLSPRPNKPNDSKHSWRKPFIVTVILLLLLGSITAFALYRNSVAKYNNLKSAQSALQQELLKSDEASAEELKELGNKVSIIRGELDKDIPEDLQAQYQDLLLQINSLTQSSNQAVASSAQDLLAKLTNQAGAGISLSPDGKTITNSGVLSVNSQTGNLSIQGTPSQTNVTQNGSTTTIGTAQDIAQTSSPTFSNQTLTGNGSIQGGLTVGGTTTTNNLTIQSGGTQNGYALCDASNNCGYSGAGSSYVQGGNSFGNPAYLGTNDSNSLNLETNGTTRLTIDTAGNTSLTGNLTTPGSVSALSLSGNGSGVTNVDATALNGNTAGNNSGQIALNNGTINSNLNSDLLDGQHGSYYQNAGNINAGTLSDARLSSNVTLQGNSFNGINQLVQLNGSGYLPSLNGSLVTNVDALTLQGNSASYFTNASNIASGTLSDLRLSSNVPLKNATNTFTGTNNFAGITATGILQGGYSVCDASNNCNYATNSQFASAILQGGNSFGTTMRIGTNDSQSLVLKSNNVDAMTIASDGRIGINSTPSAVYRLSVNADARAMFVGHVSIPVLDNSFSLNVSNYYQSHGAIGIRLNAGTTAPHIRSYLDSTKVFEVGSAGQGYFAGNTSIGTTSDLGQLAVVNTSTTQAVMVVRGASGQTGDLQQWQNSSGTVLSYISADGQIWANSSVASGYAGLRYTDRDNTANGIIVGEAYGNYGIFGANGSGNTNQSPLYVAISNANNSNGAYLKLGTGTGAAKTFGINFDAGGYSAGSGAPLSINTWNGVANSASSTIRLEVGHSNNTSLIVRSMPSQTADLQQWQNSGGVIYGQLSSAGSLTLGPVTTSNINTAITLRGGYNNGSTALTLNSGSSNPSVIGSGAGNALVIGSASGLMYCSTGGCGTAWGLISPQGNLTMGSVSTNIAQIAAINNSSSEVALVARGSVSQTANLQEWQNSTGTVLAALQNTGNLTLTQDNANLNVGTSQKGYIAIGTQGSYSGNFANRGAMCIDTACIQGDGGGGLTSTNSAGTMGTGFVRSGGVYGNSFGSFSNRVAIMNTLEVLSNTKAHAGFNITPVSGVAALFGTSSTSNVNIASRATLGQTADLLQAQDSTGTVLARITASGDLTVKNASVEGAYITFSNNIRGYNMSVAASATSQTVSFGTAHPDANYAVFCTPDWNTSCYVSNKTTNGFTLNYGTAAPAAQQVDWFVAR